MDIKFKRSIIGYNSAAVTEKLSDLEQEFARRCSDLRRVLADRVHDRDLLKVQLDRLKQDLAAKLALQEEIATLSFCSPKCNGKSNRNNNSC